jgi:hypothetical protein
MEWTSRVPPLEGGRQNLVSPVGRVPLSRARESGRVGPAQVRVRGRVGPPQASYQSNDILAV